MENAGKPNSHQVGDSISRRIAGNRNAAVHDCGGTMRF